MDRKRGAAKRQPPSSDDGAPGGGGPKPPAKRVRARTTEATPQETARRSGRAVGQAAKEGAALNQRAEPEQSEEPKLWCSACSRPAAAACVAEGHAVADVAASRRQAAAALRAALAALDGLDDLECRGAPRLRAAAEVEGLGLGRSSECRRIVVITLCLRGGDLAGGGAAALCALVNALDMQNFDKYLSASPANDEDLRPHLGALAGLVAALPERVDGIALRPGAVLVLDSDRAEGQDEELDVDGGVAVGDLNESFSPSRRNWLSRPSRFATLAARKSAPIVATGRRRSPSPDEEEDDDELTEEDDDGGDDDVGGLESESPVRRSVGALRVQSSSSALSSSAHGNISGQGPGVAAARQWSPAVRIYYNRRVKPHEAKGARILGYITRNLEHLGEAKPRGPYYHPGWGMRNHDGHGVRFSEARLLGGR